MKTLYVVGHQKKINRAIKWVAERSESFLTDIHGRDHVTHAELAVTKDGKFLGFKNETIANLGAYARVFGTVTLHIYLDHVLQAFMIYLRLILTLRQCSQILLQLMHTEEQEDQRQLIQLRD